MIYQQQAVGIMFLMNFIISSIPGIYMQLPVKEKSEVRTVLASRWPFCL